MFTIDKKSDDRVDLAISDTITREEMRDGLDALLEQSQGMIGGTMLYTISNLRMPDLSALAVEMRYLPRLFSLISRIDRIALVADQNWIRNMAQVESALIPGLVINVFEPGDEAAAEAWLAKSN